MKKRKQIENEIVASRPKMKQTSLYLRAELFELLGEYCEEKGFKISEVLNKLLADFLDGYQGFKKNK